MKNYQKTIAMLTVTALLLGAAPALAHQAAAASAKTGAASKSSALKGVSAQQISTAQKKLKEVTGKTYTFSKAEKWTQDKNSGWDLQIKEVAHGQVSLTNGQVDMITLDQKWADLKDTYKQQIQSALKLANADGTEPPDTVTLTIGYSSKYINPGKLELFTQAGNTYLTLLDGKVKRIMSPLAPEEVPKAALQETDKITEGLGGVTKGELIKASAVLNAKGEKTYELQFSSQDKKSPIFVNIKEATGQITKVEVSSLADSAADYSKGYNKLKNYTAKQLSENAKSSAQHFLNIDLTGYTAAKDEKNPGTAVFSKKNAPSIKGQYNTKGQFYNLELAE
ncbi:hypothetical protein ABEO75_12505 [Paenibacillus macerans]|uniref:hypothetical protein n=1 Tax=Paenibacillus macerans TaxID=44252 RepID=UPI002E21C525|nr:hypothetical protein [Paenibacillus macerans]